MASPKCNISYDNADDLPSPFVVNIYKTPMRANALLKHNIDALLRGRGQTRKDLAQWCRRTESWISKIFRSDKREMPLQYVDRIADFFGIATYQLFSPGISRLTERRVGERRTKQERRIGPAHRAMMSTAAELEPYRPQRKGASHVAVVASSPVMEALHRATADYERRVSALLAQAGAGGQTATTRRALPQTPDSRRAAGGSHSEKP